MERLAMEQQQREHSSFPDSPDVDKPSGGDRFNAGRTKKPSSKNTSLNTSGEEKERKSKKKQKLYCVCRKPYDKSK